MESAFSIYSKIGFHHIADINAYDHILFVVALCAIYKLNEWKRVAILVTAFTIGHSVTLALAALDVITFPKDVIELLIPVTIVLTCLYNIFSKSNSPRAGKMTPEKIAYLTRQIMVNYFFAFFFGLIHGMGFSNYLKSVLDADESLVWSLFAFNVGL
ncbi:MAG: HupE/UreJ family protein, partial [Saprospiraceae bacterium]